MTISARPMTFTCHLLRSQYIEGVRTIDLDSCVATYCSVRISVAPAEVSGCVCDSG